jgi:hypothetical protein
MHLGQSCKGLFISAKIGPKITSEKLTVDNFIDLSPEFCGLKSIYPQNTFMDYMLSFKDLSLGFSGLKSDYIKLKSTEMWT